ncbi:hypothetical protein [Sorangium sp. So ce1000]
MTRDIGLDVHATSMTLACLARADGGWGHTSSRPAEKLFKATP